jgi:hypothetical protein
MDRTRMQIVAAEFVTSCRRNDKAADTGASDAPGFKHVPDRTSVPDSCLEPRYFEEDIAEPRTKRSSTTLVRCFWSRE